MPGKKERIREILQREHSDKQNTNSKQPSLEAELQNLFFGWVKGFGLKHFPFSTAIRNSMVQYAVYQIVTFNFSILGLSFSSLVYTLYKYIYCIMGGGGGEAGR